MEVEFTLELFGYDITDTVEILDDELLDIPNDEKYDFIYEYVSREIENNIQLYVQDPTGED